MKDKESGDSTELNNLKKITAGGPARKKVVQRERV